MREVVADPGRPDPQADGRLLLSRTATSGSSGVFTPGDAPRARLAASLRHRRRGPVRTGLVGVVELTSLSKPDAAIEELLSPRRSVRGDLFRRSISGQARRSRRLRLHPARARRAAGVSGLRRADDEVRLPWRLRRVPRAAGGDQSKPLSRAAAHSAVPPGGDRGTRAALSVRRSLRSSWIAC